MFDPFNDSLAHRAIKKVVKKAGIVERKHKNIVHGVVLLVITVSLLHEGAEHADWSFLVLSVLCEIGGGDPVE